MNEPIKATVRTTTVKAMVSKGAPGRVGASAYEVWLALGNSGTEEEYLASLVGPEGQSAYDAWLAEGNSGTIEDFLQTAATGEGITHAVRGSAAAMPLGSADLLGVLQGSGMDALRSATLDSLKKFILESPNLTGSPVAPTATEGTNTQQVATTAFVMAALAALVSSAPATLDTLKELAQALGNDTNFSTTVTNLIAGKASKGANADIESLSGLTTPLSISQGGTSASTAAGARQALGIPESASLDEVVALIIALS